MRTPMTSPKQDAISFITQQFAAASLSIEGVEAREYPDETIFVVRVPADGFEDAVKVGNRLDSELMSRGIAGFVTVRRSEGAASGHANASGKLEKGVQDPRALALANLLTSRARTSEAQPSLSYVPDTANNLTTAVSARHHLIFGRRGAGKTALMIEAKRLAEEQGALCAWINLQTHRKEGARRSLLWLALKLCELIQIYFRDRSNPPVTLVSASTLRDAIERQLLEQASDSTDADTIVPQINHLLRRFLTTTDLRIFIFIDEFHYLDRKQQPLFLDLAHGAVRDCNAWLKVAAIKHLSRWFQQNPPLGLQTGHDADHIDLDVTLQNPSKAKAFLEKVLTEYARHEHIAGLGSVFSSEALDRLVLASGAVPRDFIVLSAKAIREAQRREKSRLVGVQDVNNAAGEEAQVKTQELEDDASSSAPTTQGILRALNAVRTFCLDEKHFTFVRVDFHDKERRTNEYALLQNLMDLRLVHLINPSVSDRHEAGRRAEVFMLDLSQFSGQRLKKNLSVLDLIDGNLALKKTGTSSPMRIASTPPKLQALLRLGPILDLQRLGPDVSDE